MLWFYNAIARKTTDIPMQRDMLINTIDEICFGKFPPKKVINQSIFKNKLLETSERQVTVRWEIPLKGYRPSGISLLLVKVFALFRFQLIHSKSVLFVYSGY